MHSTQYTITAHPTKLPHVVSLTISHPCGLEVSGIHMMREAWNDPSEIAVAIIVNQIDGLFDINGIIDLKLKGGADA